MIGEILYSIKEYSDKYTNVFLFFFVNDLQVMRHSVSLYNKRYESASGLQCYHLYS